MSQFIGTIFNALHFFLTILRLQVVLPHELLELDLPDHVGIDCGINIILGSLSHFLHVVLVVVNNIVLLDEFQKYLVDLSQ